MSRHTSGRIAGSCQTGVALITALLVVALATIVTATLAWDSYLNIRRTANLLNMDQAMLYALGAESWGVQVLNEDLQNGNPDDHFGEEWAYPLPPLTVEGGVIQGGLEDMQGRFNINNLVDAQGERDQLAIERFERLLDAIGIETKFASLAADWIDVDINPGFPEGAEDGLYTGFEPPYKPPNGPMTNLTELLAMPEFTTEQLEFLRPYVTVLPPGTLLNVCTAPIEVIQSMDTGFDAWTPDAEDLAEDRANGCYPTITDLQGYVAVNVFQDLPLGESSAFFRATTRVSIGTTQLTMYSLLERDIQGGTVRTIIRSLGTE